MIVKADCESDGSFYLTITDLGADLVLGDPGVPHTVPATGQRHRGAEAELAQGRLSVGEVLAMAYKVFTRDINIVYRVSHKTV